MIQFNFTRFPEMSTQRLQLRQLKTEDENEIFQLRCDEKVNEFLDRAKPHTVEDAREFIKKINSGITCNQWMYWAIVPVGEDKLIGTVCLWNIVPGEERAEIGYELLPSAQGKGFMQEVFSLIIPFAFENLKLRKIEAYLMSENKKSLNLLEKYSFKRDVEAETRLDPAGKEMDMIVYSLCCES